MLSGRMVDDEIESIVLLLAMLTIAAMTGNLHGAFATLTFRSWAAQISWILLLMTSILLLPSCAAGYVKVGGYVNNFGISHYFLVLSATVGIASLWPRMRLQMPGLATLVRASVCAVIVIRTGAVPQLPKGTYLKCCR